MEWIIMMILYLILTVVDIMMYAFMSKRLSLIEDIVIGHTKILDIVIKDQIERKRKELEDMTQNQSRCWRMDKEEIKDESNDKHADGSEDQS